MELKIKDRLPAKRILVTGAAGFMGSHEVEALVSMGYETYAVDDFSGGFPENIPKGCKFTRLDLRDRHAVERYMKKIRPDIIFHDAAFATEGGSQFTPINSTERNYNIYLNTLVAGLRHGMKKMVFASSMSVYGGQKAPFSEEMPRMPEDVYAVAKAASEHTTELLSRVHGFEYTIIRPHNVYGVRQNLSDPYRNVIAIFINRLMQGKPFFIYGNGSQHRSFTYIDDYTPYILKAGLSRRFNREIFNIGPRETVSIKGLAELVIKEYFGSMKQCPKHLLPRYLPDRPLEVKLAYCTHHKAEKLLGYRTSVSIEQGVSRMVAWARSKGPQEFVYLKGGLELVSRTTPSTWSKKLY